MELLLTEILTKIDKLVHKLSKSKTFPSEILSVLNFGNLVEAARDSVLVR